MKYSIKSLFLILQIMMPSSLYSALVVDIRPSQDMQSVEWRVSWDNHDGRVNFFRNYTIYYFMNPNTGETGTNFGLGISRVGWRSVGDVYTDVYHNGGDDIFMDGVLGVRSTPSGWGVGAWGGSGTDGVLIANSDIPYDDLVSTSGEFLLTIPGANIDKYNIGVYDSNSDVTVTVSAIPIPEPSTALLSSCLFLLAFRRGRTRNRESGGCHR